MGERIEASFIQPDGAATRRRQKLLATVPADRHGHFARGDLARLQELKDDKNYEVFQDGKEDVSGGKRSGGDVLVTCPRDEWEARLRERAMRNKKFLDGPREAFKTQGQRHGVETFDKTRTRIGTMESELGKDPGTD